MIRTVPGSGGWLEVVCGPMFSGKSEELIRRLRRAEIAGQRVLIVKPRIDDRYDVAHVVSHAGARMRAVAVDGVRDALRRRRGLRRRRRRRGAVLRAGIVDAVEQMVLGGKRVVAAGLDRDFRGEPFGPMPLLLCMAEFVDKLQAVCHAAAAPRRARSGSSTASPRRSTGRRSRSARSTRTRRAAAPAIAPASPRRSRPPSSDRAPRGGALSSVRRRPRGTRSRARPRRRARPGGTARRCGRGRPSSRRGSAPT